MNLLDFVVIDADPTYDNRMDATLKVVHADSTLRLITLHAVTDLVLASHANKGTTEGHIVFLDHGLTQAMAEAHGRALNEAGGINLMQFAHAMCVPMFAEPSDGRMLEFAWDRIGEWLA